MGMILGRNDDEDFSDVGSVPLENPLPSIMKEQVKRILWIQRHTGLTPNVLDLPPKEFHQLLDELGSIKARFGEWRDGEHGVCISGVRIIKNRRAE